MGYLHHRWSFVLAAVVAQASMITPALGADWPQWGGPHGDFTTDSTGLADKWPADGPKKIWSRPLGAGYSAISVVGDRLYTVYRQGEREVVIALNARTGDTVWEHGYESTAAKEQEKNYGTGPNSTPLVLDDRIITIGFTGQVHCLDRETGKVRWSKDLVNDYQGKVQEYGYSASPILYKGNVLVLVGGKTHGLIAFDPKDGKPAWTSDPFDISYASPVIIDVDGQDQIVVMASTEVIGMTADAGKILWRHPCINRYKNNATDPIWCDGNILMVATELDGGGRGLRLTRDGDKTSVEQIWFNKNARVFHWNAIRIGDYVYASLGDTKTFFSAVDVRTGEIKWKHRGFHKALCVLADGKMIFLDENGVLALAKVSPEGIDVRSQVQLTEKVSWTIPTLVGTTLYVRDQKQIMALDVG